MLATSCDSIYLVLCLCDACKKDNVGNEEADAEMQVDGSSWALDGTDHWERQDAEEQTD